MYFGFSKNQVQNLIVMDGDLQHKPSDIKKFLLVFRKSNPDIIVGSRDLFKNKNIILIFLDFTPQEY